MSNTPTSEHTTKHELTTWLCKHGAGVLWEESNEWDHPTFHIDRDTTGGRPDLIVLLDGKTFVVEYKTGDSVSQVYDARPQVLGYWLEHVRNEQQYMAGDTTLRIDGFLTATSHTPAGRLFPRDVEVRVDYADMDSTRQSCYEWAELPPAEYRMTEQHIRSLWRDVKLFAEVLDIDDASGPQTPHVGSLLSDALIEPSDSPSPAVLWNKTQKNQCWEVLE
jgi:hypothetical protein